MRYTAFSTTSSTSFCGQHVQLRCFCIGLADCYFAERGAKREKAKHPVRDKNRKNYSAGSRELKEPTVRSRPPGGWPDQSIQARSGAICQPRGIPVCPSSRRNNLLTAAETDPACSILPRAPHGVTRDSCSVFLASGEQFPSNQPAHRSLRRTLRKSNRLGQLLITHLNGSLPTCLFGRKPYIDKEAGGSPVVADQVAHQHVYDVIIQVQHGYTGQ